MEKLQAKCSERNCTIELKEIGKEDYNQPD